MITVWFLVIFGLGWDASAGAIPQATRADCVRQADWINDTAMRGDRQGHAYCVQGLMK